MGTLEAIKLFLSVRKMAFVLAADEDLIRAAIEAQMEGAARAGFAKLYTEKIVQLPLSLPLLSVDQAEAYVALLLCRNAGAMSSGDLGAVIAVARERRRLGTAPYVVAGGDASGPSASHLALAASIARGAATRTADPRPRGGALRVDSDGTQRGGRPAALADRRHLEPGSPAR
nr:P-loop NTPase fold protein [Phytohabitans suffuscus]